MELLKIFKLYYIKRRKECRTGVLKSNVSNGIVIISRDDVWLWPQRSSRLAPGTGNWDRWQVHEQKVPGMAVLGGKCEKQCQGPQTTFLGYCALFKHAQTAACLHDQCWASTSNCLHELTLCDKMKIRSLKNVGSPGINNYSEDHQNLGWLLCYLNFTCSFMIQLLL